ncbi:MAG: DNA polymerase [Bacilli bacterium]
MHTLNCDIETYSSVDLKKSGMHKYVQSPDFEILLFGYSLDGAPVRVVDLAQGQTLRAELVDALRDPSVIKRAYNAPFEWYALSKFYETPLSQWSCTMIHGLYCGYTAGLGATAVALGLPEDKRKMGVGMALIRTFCIPCKPSAANGQRTRTLPHHEPQKWELFKTYCAQDVVTEQEIERRLSAFASPPQEQRLWELDQRINARGVAVDLDLVDGALHCDQVVGAELLEEAVALSGLKNPKSGAQLKKWLTDELDEDIEDLRKDTVSDLLKTLDEGAAKRMLELRQQLSKTSIKKYISMRAAACEDGRIRGMFQFYGANRTGRWAARLTQPQNMPKNYLETLAHARDCVKSRKIDALKVVYGNVPTVLSQLTRTALIPSPGNVLLVSDFSAIEARILAWLAGEQWVLDVFTSHGKIYEAAASQMFGVPVEAIVKGQPEYELRQKGKIAVLALGYGGGSPALINMGALNQGLTEEELPEIKHRWRAANKRIVDLWYAVENAALDVMRSSLPRGVRGLLLARESEYNSGQDFLTLLLPSGRKLYYARPFLSINDRGSEALYYWGMGQKTKKWGSISTWGGKLVENITQAIARDCLAESLMRLDAAGYRTVMHVHDEVVADQPSGVGSIEEMTAIMSQPIAWANGLPLRAEGFATRYYKKD